LFKPFVIFVGLGFAHSQVAPIKAAEKPSGARVAAKKLAGAETNFAAAQKQLFDTQQKLHGDQSATKKEVRQRRIPDRSAEYRTVGPAS